MIVDLVLGSSPGGASGTGAGVLVVERVVSWEDVASFPLAAPDAANNVAKINSKIISVSSSLCLSGYKTSDTWRSGLGSFELEAQVIPLNSDAFLPRSQFTGLEQLLINFS
jgi:hypothetical protein